MSDRDRVAHPPWRAVPQEVGREHERQVEERRYRVQDADAGEDVAPGCTEELKREAGVGPLPKHGEAAGKEGENTEHLRDAKDDPNEPRQPKLLCKGERELGEVQDSADA